MPIADADHELMAVDVVGRGDLFDEPAGQRERRGIAALAELHHGELVAAEPRHGIVFASTHSA